ncbi:MAG: hypothetical protein RLZZ488_2015 [Pseudomonadota bacterium]|jgi:flagellar FliL protein
MSKKEEKKPAEDKKADTAKAEKGPPDEIAEARKKRKLVLFAGIGGVVAAAAAGGGFFVYKTFMQKGASMAAKAPVDGKDVKVEGDKKDHADGKSDGKSDKKEDGKDGKKEEASTDKKEDVKDKKAEEKKEDAKAADSKDGDKKAADKKDDGKSGADSAKKDAAGAAKKDEAATAPKDEKSDLKMFQSDQTFGETFALPKMDLNLGNPLENRYLRIGVSIEYTGGKNQQEELKKREPQLRDIIISSVSTRTRLDLLTERGKEKLRRELINKINESFERPVKTIYFTDFLVE